MILLIEKSIQFLKDSSVIKIKLYNKTKFSTQLCFKTPV